MPNITIIGAGAYVFPLVMARDILSHKALRGSTMCVYDIDARRNNRNAAARKIPIIDLYGEMVSRQPNGKWKGTLVGRDGVHLTHRLSDGPPTKENLANCGYLLRCWLTVQKPKEVKAKVIDKAHIAG